MKTYVKVINDEVVEIRRNSKKLKPAGINWRELELNKPNFDNETEMLVIDGYTILENKVIENYRVEPINFEPMPVENDEFDY